MSAILLATWNETFRVPRLCEPCQQDTQDKQDTRLTQPWHSERRFNSSRWKSLKTTNIESHTDQNQW